MSADEAQDVDAYLDLLQEENKDDDEDEPEPPVVVKKPKKQMPALRPIDPDVQDADFGLAESEQLDSKEITQNGDGGESPQPTPVQQERDEVVMDSKPEPESSAIVDELEGEQQTVQDGDDEVDDPEAEKPKVKKKRKKKIKKLKPADGIDDGEDGDQPKAKRRKKDKLRKDKKEKKEKKTKKAFERRDIRDVIDDEKLEDSTKNARAEEEARMQRLMEQQQRRLAEAQAQAEAEAMRELELDHDEIIEEEYGEYVESEVEELEDGEVLVSPPTKPKAKQFQTIDLSSDSMSEDLEDDGEDLDESDDIDDNDQVPTGKKTSPLVRVQVQNGTIVVKPADGGKKGAVISKPIVVKKKKDSVDHDGQDDDKEDEEEAEGSDMEAEKKDDAEGGDDGGSDSDIKILSGSEISDDDDPDNCGMHTNDKLNTHNADGRVQVNVSEKDPAQEVFVNDGIAKIIKPHQIGGVRFLYDNIVESPETYEKSTGFGCILAHAMGLGKTLQIITFTDVFLRYTKGRHVLIIVPINTIQNWTTEFKNWLGDEQVKVFLLNDTHKSLPQRSQVVLSWKSTGGVLLIGYEMFRLLAGSKKAQKKKKPTAREAKRLEEESKAKKSDDDNSNPAKEDALPEADDKDKDVLQELKEALLDPGPDLVVCDEGHRIKNALASISQVLKAIKTRRRVVLTGYPLQNNLMEYWCMVDFVRPNYLGNKTEFSNMFERPIQNGQCIDSTPRDIRLMMHRAHVLHTKLQGFVQRRSHAVLRKNLPPKIEHVLLIKMTPFQRKLYAIFTEDLLAQKSMANPLKAFAVCCKIWNHPDVLNIFLRKRDEMDGLDPELEELGLAKKVTGPKKSKKDATAPKKGKKSKTDKSAKNDDSSKKNHESNLQNGFQQHQQLPPSRPHPQQNMPPTGSVGLNGYPNYPGSGVPPMNQPYHQQNGGMPHPSHVHSNFAGIPQHIMNGGGRYPSPNPYQQQYPQQQQHHPGMGVSNQMNPMAGGGGYPGYGGGYPGAAHGSNPNMMNPYYNQNGGYGYGGGHQYKQQPQQSFPYNQGGPGGYPQSNYQQGYPQQQQQQQQYSNQYSQQQQQQQMPGMNGGGYPNFQSQQQQQNPQQQMPYSPSPHPGMMPNGGLGGQNVNNMNNTGAQAQMSAMNMPMGNNYPQQPFQQQQQQQQQQFHQQQQQQFNQCPQPPSEQPLPPNPIKQESNSVANDQKSPLSDVKKEEDLGAEDAKPDIKDEVKSETAAVKSEEEKPDDGEKVEDSAKPTDEPKVPSVKADSKKESKESEKKNSEDKSESKGSDDKKTTKKKEAIVVNAGPGFDPMGGGGGDPAKKDEISYDWAKDLFTDYVAGLIENSNKFVIFFQLLDEAIKIGERMLMFSQSLLTLDLIEDYLSKRTIPGTDGQPWCNGLNYFRLDGSTSASERDRLINEFNRAEAIKVPLFLVSTKAGSLGVNLVGANRVVIFDASWNPCHDSQAVCRVYRYGQDRPCYIYRLVSDKCLERKIYDRQVNKQGMSDRVVDESNPDNYLSSKDVHTLWDDDDVLQELPDIKWNMEKSADKAKKLGDDILAKLIEDFGPKCLSNSPFTHESLLVDRKEKKLSKREKRMAQRHFDQEKNAQISYTRPSYANFYPKYSQTLMKNKIVISPQKSQNVITMRKGAWTPRQTDDDFLPIGKASAGVHPNYKGITITRTPGQGAPRMNFPMEALAKKDGVKLQEFQVPRDLSIPTKGPVPISLKAGQKVILIKTPKGVYIKVKNQIVKIRMPNGMMPFGTSSSSSSSSSASGSTSAASGSSSKNSGAPQAKVVMRRPMPASVAAAAAAAAASRPKIVSKPKPDIVTLSDDDDD